MLSDKEGIFILNEIFQMGSQLVRTEHAQSTSYSSR